MIVLVYLCACFSYVSVFLIWVSALLMFTFCFHHHWVDIFMTLHVCLWIAYALITLWFSNRNFMSVIRYPKLFLVISKMMIWNCLHIISKFKVWLVRIYTIEIRIGSLESPILCFSLNKTSNGDIFNSINQIEDDITLNQWNSKFTDSLPTISKENIGINLFFSWKNEIHAFQSIILHLFLWLWWRIFVNK